MPNIKNNKPKYKIIANINTADYANRKLGDIPTYGFNPPDHFTKQLTETVGAIHQNLYDEIQKTLNSVTKAQQDLIKSLNLISIKKILWDTTNLTKLFSEFFKFKILDNHLPDNWLGSKPQEAARLCAQGIPIVFVPRTTIVSKLIEANGVPGIKKIIAHSKNSPLIINDCEKALAECGWLSKDMREHINESIISFKNAQYRAAQSTAIIAFDSLLNVVIDMSVHRKKNKKALAYTHVKQYTRWTDNIDLMGSPLVRMPFYVVLMLPVISHMLIDFSIGDKATYLNSTNRHVSSHTIDSKQYKKSNALLAIMTIASICKVTQLNDKYWLQKYTHIMTNIS
jgi:hypothetical protein